MKINKPTNEQLDAALDYTMFSVAVLFGGVAFAAAIVDALIHTLASQSARAMQSIVKWREMKKGEDTNYNDLSAVAIIKSLWGIVLSGVKRLWKYLVSCYSVRQEDTGSIDDTAAYLQKLQNMAEPSTTQVDARPGEVDHS